MSMLPLFRQAQRKVHLVDPPTRFLEALPAYLDQRQVSSVRLSGTFVIMESVLTSFQAFDQLISLHLGNVDLLEKIGHFAMYFPNLQSVTLWFVDAFYLYRLRDILSESFNRISRLKILCKDGRGDRSVPLSLQDLDLWNTSLQSFIFDSGHSTLPTDTNGSFYGFNVLRLIMEFLQSIGHVRQVRFITSEHQIQAFLEIAVWQKLITKCVHLDRVTIQLLDEGYFTQEAANIEQELRRIRPGFIFRIKSA